jgi:hypothetical protein
VSQKTIAQKLLIKENMKILLLNEPEGYKSQLGKLPKGASFASEQSEPLDLIQVFVNSKEEAEEKLGKIKKLLKPKSLLWVTYPKGTAKTKSNINRDVLREYAQTLGLQAVSLIAINEKWSAMRLKST